MYPKGDLTNFTDSSQENWIIQRVPIAKWLSLNIFLWGVCIALISAMRSFTGLVILRAFMGAFEAACQPTFVILSSTWYKREEQGSIINLWYAETSTRECNEHKY